MILIVPLSLVNLKPFKYHFFQNCFDYIKKGGKLVECYSYVKKISSF